MTENELRKKELKKLVDRFLSWPLPKSVCADVCATIHGYEHPRCGTNLLTAAEAKQMLEHVLAEQLAHPLVSDEALKSRLGPSLSEQLAAQDELSTAKNVAASREADLEFLKKTLTDALERVST